MAIVITAPNDWEKREGPGIFLAGGISGCRDWQERAIKSLQDHDVVLLNPRRQAKHFNTLDPRVGREQIVWEHRYLAQADAIVFWFPPETDCPIALYELGAWSKSDKPIIVGTHSGYRRRFDVVEQIRLVRPDLRVTNDFGDFLKDLKKLAETLPRRVYVETIIEELKKRNDPVFQSPGEPGEMEPRWWVGKECEEPFPPGWYFWDEAWSQAYGPFPAEPAARWGLDCYLAEG